MSHRSAARSCCCSLWCSGRSSRQHLLHVLLAVAAILASVAVDQSAANEDARRLFEDLLVKGSYNKLIRPAPIKENATDIKPLIVKLGMRLAQLIDVDGKNEIMTTNMWLIHKWADHNLMWNPKEYGGVKELYVDSKDIWLPDIVLYNNADGDYTVTLMTKATLTHLGIVLWEPPAIYKSYCKIDVTYFPFDMQTCDLKFGSWSYDGFQVDIEHVWTEGLKIDQTEKLDVGIDLKSYYTHVEWDVMNVPAKKSYIEYTCCPEPFPDITFTIQLRRKTLFYIINLIIPCVSINMLALLTFYLPADSNEKISLSTSILLSLSLFQLLLMESTPSTSLVIPLLGKYILFTMILVAASILLSVVSMNIHHRSSSIHVMSNFTRVLFLNILPRILMMKRPDFKNKHTDDFDCDMFSEGAAEMFSPVYNEPSSIAARSGTAHNDTSSRLADRRNKSSTNNIYHQRVLQETGETETDLNRGFSRGGSDHGAQITSPFVGAEDCLRNSNLSIFCPACSRRNVSQYPPHVQKAFGSVCFVAKHLGSDLQSTHVREEWKFITMVVDRVLLYVYIIVCLVGTVGMIVQAPALFDRTSPITDRPEDYIINL